MTNTEPRLDAAALLAHTDWMHELARQLVFDEGRADDIVQDALVVALRSSPRLSGSVRGWLATVVRNLAKRGYRDQQRRVRRESVAARSELCSESTHDLVARAELQSKLILAVLDLEEPFRSTVLHRFFDNQTPAEIAKGLGLPAATVRSRLKRGLDQLRKRLDQDFDGDRPAWSLLLIRSFGSDLTAAAAAPVQFSSFALVGVLLSLGLGILFLVPGLFGEHSNLGEKSMNSPLGQAKLPSEFAADTGQEEVSGRVSPAAQAHLLEGVATVHEGGQALAGVQLLYHQSNKSRVVAVSGADGKFSWNSAPDEKFSVSFSHPHYYSMPKHVPNISERVPLKVSMKIAAAISGRVINQDTGAPIANARVRGKSDILPDFQQALSDEDGRYSLYGIPPFVYEIKAAAQGFVKPPRRYLHPPELKGHVEFDLLLEAGVTIRGQAVDAQGAAVAGAKVECDFFNSGGVTFQAICDSDGSFVLTAPLGVQLSLRLTSEKLISRAICPFVLGSSGKLLGEVLMIPVRRITGIVVDENNQPLSHQMLSFSMNSFSSFIETDADGYFEQLHLMPGRYTVFSPRKVATFVIEEEDLVDQVIVVGQKPKGSVILGRACEFDLRGILDALVRVQPSAGGPSKRFTSGLNGHFSCSELEPGEYDLCIRGQWFRGIHTDRPEQEFRLRKRQELEFLVVDALDGAAITLLEHTVQRFSSSKHSTITGNGGRPVFCRGGAIQVRRDPHFRLKLTVRANGYQEWTTTLPAFADVTSQQLRVPLLKLASGVQARVVDIHGQPVSGAKIFAAFFQQGRALPLVISDEDGYFSAAAVRQDVSMISIQHSDYVRKYVAWKPQNLQQSPLQFVLSSGVLLEGQVVTPDGVKVRGVACSQVGEAINADLDEEGRFRFRLEAGSAKLAVKLVVDADRSETQRNLNKIVEVPAAAKAFISIEVPALNSRLLGRVSMPGEVASANVEGSVKISSEMSFNFFSPTEIGGQYSVGYLPAGPIEIKRDVGDLNAPSLIAKGKLLHGQASTINLLEDPTGSVRIKFPPIQLQETGFVLLFEGQQEWSVLSQQSRASLLKSSFAHASLGSTGQSAFTAIPTGAHTILIVRAPLDYWFVPKLFAEHAHFQLKTIQVDAHKPTKVEFPKDMPQPSE